MWGCLCQHCMNGCEMGECDSHCKALGVITKTRKALSKNESITIYTASLSFSENHISECHLVGYSLDENFSLNKLTCVSRQWVLDKKQVIIIIEM